VPKDIKIYPYLWVMFFSPSPRINPATGESEAYYRIKESYRDCLGHVHSIVLLSPGFIKGYTGSELFLTSKALNKLKENKGVQSTLFGDILNEYPEKVAALAREYWSLMESKGTIDTFQERKRRDENSLKGRTMLRGETLTHNEGLDLGAEWLCLQTIRQLGLDTFLLSLGWSEDKVGMTMAHLITRTVYTPSELKSIRIMQENSAVADILGIDREVLKKHNIYSVAPSLLEIKDKLDTYLTHKTDSLFGLTNRIFLYDLTNFYWESPKRSSCKAKFGRSKEKRNDCKLLVLALCVNRAGFIRYSAILEGNTADPKSLPDMIDELAKKNPTCGDADDKALVVIDAGISSEENLALIKEKGFHYLCVSRKNLTNYELSDDARTVMVKDSKEQEIRLTEVKNPDNGDYYLMVNSPSKALTEESMNRQYRQRFEDMLEGVKKGLSTKGGIKKYDKVCERIGRARAKYPSVQRFYQIDYTLDQTGTKVTDITWSIKSPEKMDANVGIYFLRTDKPEMDEKTTWSYYNIIREIEATNRQLKTDLNLRPIYHQKDTSSDAHLYLGLLSYWIVNTIRHQLKEKGERSYWSEIVRTMSTQKLVRSTAVNALDEIVDMDICTKPTQAAAAIYDKLGFRHYPFRRIKICSAQTSFQKNLKL